MSSCRSTETSAIESDQKLDWRAWLWCWGAVFATTVVALYACVLLVDPFATGRFALTQRVDVTSADTRLSKAGLVRDPQFDSAIFGNSAAFPLDPAFIGIQTGRHVVQLSISGTVPGEQLFLARLFARHHPGIATLVIFMLEDFWCRSGSTMDDPFAAFPFWLYDSDNSEYLSHIFSWRSLIATGVRIGVWLNFVQSFERADGFGPAFKAGNPKAVSQALLTVARAVDGPPPDGPYPAIEALAEHLSKLPRHSTVALIFLPTFANALPAEGSAAAMRLDACKARLMNVARGRPGTGYVDLRLDNSLTRDLHNFDDPIHFKSAVAQWVAAETVRIIKELASSKVAPASASLMSRTGRTHVVPDGTND
jgi:hypothetical protein